MTGMRIIDLQRRLREVGRIRIGEQVPAGQGTRPKKLEHFRLTSRDQFVIDAAAEQWGGEARPWANAPDGEQWEVYTEAKVLPVVVPPGDLSFSQSYEVWSAGGCKVRCDGRWDHLADKACHCNPEDRACDIHTRLSVMLPDLPGVGIWRLDTKGYYAAVELGGIVDLVAAHAERGIMLPARLRLEQRSVKRVDKGKVVTRRFAVPVLDLDVHPLELGRGAHAPGGELAAGAQAALPSGLTPVPPPDALAAPTLAEQMAQVGEPTHRPPRANAAAEVPATGIAPRTAREAEAGDDERPPVVQHLQGKAEGMERAQHIAMRARDLGVERAHVISAVTGGAKTSAKALDDAESGAVLDALRRMEAGEWRLVETDGGGFQLVDAPAVPNDDEVAEGELVGDSGEGASSAPGPDEEEAVVVPDAPADGPAWRALIKSKKRTLSATITRAAHLAHELEVAAPASVNDLPSCDPNLQVAILTWLDGE